MIVNKPQKKKKSSRYTVLYIIMLIIMGTILAKLLYLQVYKHEDYAEKADVSSTRFISEKAPRGKIYDSEGNVLATNKQTYVLTYMQTTESTKAFYSTMKKVFKILDDNSEKFQDDLLLKINSSGGFYFDFKSDDAETNRAVEIRFKRDRGLNEEIEKRLFKDEKRDLTDAEISKVNDELMKITPEQTFYKLVEMYGLYGMLLPDNYTDKDVDALDKKYEDVDGEKIVKDLKKQ